MTGGLGQGFQMRHILTGGSGSIGCGSAWKS